MLAGIKGRLTYANVMATIAVFIALGGVAWAAATINSGDIIDNSLKSVDLKDGKGVKAADIVPSDVQDPGLDVRDTSGIIICITDTWFTPLNAQAAFSRDPLGQVHLTGAIRPCGTPTNQVFTLPEGFRPAADDVALPVSDASGGATLSVDQDGTVSVQGFDGEQLALNGLTFRCGPSGQDDCP